MTKIEARVLYSEVRAEGNGMYVWTDPGEGSVLKLANILRGAPFKTKDVTELHTTVIHCKGPLPEAIAVPHDRWLEARAKEIVVWIDHKDRAIVVLLLASNDLEDLHQEFTTQGLAHSQPEYHAHITLGKDVEQGPELRLWLQEQNERLRAVAHNLVFGPQLKAAALD